MKVRAYIFFPETDDNFFRLGADPETYRSIVKTVAIIRDVLKKIEAEFWFDSENLSQFATKSNVVVEGKYLANIASQLRRLFGNTAQDIKALKISNEECNYIKWNTDFSFTELNPLMLEAAESAISHQEFATILINVNDAVICERDTFNVIKDATHINNLPILIRIPLFNNEFELKEWISSIKSPTNFSLRNKARFQATGKVWVKQMIYVEKQTGNFWYYDFYHRENKEHFEVFDSTGLHLGEADKDGQIIPNTKDENKKISNII